MITAPLIPYTFPCLVLIFTHINLYLFLPLISYLGQGQVLIQAYLQVEERGQGQCSSDPKQEQDKWAGNGIENDVGKPCHHCMHHIKTFTRIKQTLESEATQNIKSVVLQTTQRGR